MQFENFQNITCAHKSRNALAFIKFPILTVFETRDAHVMEVMFIKEKLSYIKGELSF